ncbi:hypothetical protein [Chelativorans alearense]|uniref:hypothetical protein n=1 Tax=Chelativorans alearense TaxID=2681495 RepID=UPI0013CF5DA0|nr:hypothetical protein [Chelativorans alearense]
MEATSAAVPSPLPAEIQPTQVQVTMEQQLFDYLVEIEKGLGAAGQFTDPSALIGTTLKTVDGIAQQAREAFEKANAGFSTATDPQADAAGPDGGRVPEENLALSLDRAISVMWAAANVSMTVNGMTAATSSANTLIQQQ